MNSSDDSGWRRPRSYHHGNLKEVLLEAARKLIEEHGAFGFSLTEAARLAGVSPAAPYRHFRDRDALLAEVAKSGFERFAARLDMAWNNGVTSDGALYFAHLRSLVFDHDLAGLVGNILKNDFDLKNDILAIDGVTLHDFDFIDLGKVLEPSGTVPVTIKSLVFQF